MKLTIEIADDLLNGARRLARRDGRTLRSVVEEGLERVLANTLETTRFELPDRSVGRAGDPNPLAGLSWKQIRARVYR